MVIMAGVTYKRCWRHSGDIFIEIPMEIVDKFWIIGIV